MKDDICNYGMTEILDWFNAAIEKEGEKRRNEMIELADIIDRALHRKKIMNRVLALEEVKALGKDYDAIVYIENELYDGWYEPQLHEGNNYSYIQFYAPGEEEDYSLSEQTYDVDWRCWLYKPTEEEKSGTPWKK